MTDKQKTKQELIQELDILRQRVAVLDKSELARKKAEALTEEKQKLNEMLLSSLPHPAMLIRGKDKVILAANRIALDCGVKIGGQCWREFGKTAYISQKNREIIEKYQDIVPAELGVKCTFCHGDECFSEAPKQNNPEVHAFDKIWDTYWIRVSDDIYLHYAIDISERKWAEEALQEKTHELGERVKELNCLYALSKVIERSDSSLPEIFEGSVNIIPPGWQYPEITCACLVFEDQIFKTPNFNETIWKQGSPIQVDGRSAGTLEVYYLEEKQECDEGPFLKEERDLIDALTGRLENTIQRKRAEEALRKRSLELQQLTATLEQRVLERTAELEKANESLRHLSSRLLSAEEDERKRIAREVHDVLGSSLSAIKFKMEDILQRIHTIPMRQVIEGLENLFPVIKGTIDDVRRIQADLHPPLLDDLGIVATLSWYCRRFEAIYSDIKVEQTVTIQEEEVPDNLKITLFRITQEALNNIGKHAKADSVSLGLRKVDGTLELCIRDNGKGVDPLSLVSGENSKKGLGLSSMNERTKFSGGSFSFDSVKGRGTVIRAVWPV
jgi:signal transduction histidine kinase